MYWFDLLFPPAMLLFPVLMCALWRGPADAKVDAVRVRKLSRLLWLGTGLALGAFAAVWWNWGGPVARHMWVLCWFLYPVAMLLLSAKNPDLTTHNSGAATRTASLVNRRHTNPVPKSAWVLAWAIWLVGAAAVAWRFVQPEANLSAGSGWLASGLVGLAAICPALTMWCVRMVREEPEPRDERGSAELSAAYDRLRSFRIWSMFALFGIVMPLVMLSFAVLMAWLPMDGRTGMLLGIMGGVVGTVIGLAGATVGTLASIHRARINGMLRRMQQQG